LRVGLLFFDVRGPGDLTNAFEAIAHQRADALLLFPDTVTLAHRKPILDYAAGRRLPAMYPFREMVDEGGLIRYGPNIVESLRTAAGPGIFPSPRRRSSTPSSTSRPPGRSA
jgi:hypothetical protein